MEYAEKHNSLTWFDYMYFRVLKSFKGESRQSLELGDLSYILKLNEYLDIEDFMEEVHQRYPSTENK